MGAAILNSTIASLGNAHLYLQVKIANGGNFPGNKVVHLERAICLPYQHSILV